MAEITIKIIENKQEWEAFLMHHNEVNFLQSWYWGEFHEQLGKIICRTGFYKHNQLVGVMLSVVEPARRGKYLTVPGGPIIDWQDTDVVSKAFAEMRSIAKENQCVFVRIRPQLIADDFSKNIFQKHGSRNAPMYLHAELTSQLDITKPEDELLAQMRKTTRYEIRKGEKLGIIISQNTDEKAIKAFYDLQLETAKRQSFVPFSYPYFLEQFKIFFIAEKALLYTATFENKVLAQAFIIFYGSEAVYHYGASTEDGRRYPGAYLLQWEAIKEAKRRGMKRYNFWGVAPLEQTDHRFSGISLFKRGFGGEDVHYLQAQDIVINRQKYTVNFLIEKVRRMVRKV